MPAQTILPAVAHQTPRSPRIAGVATTLVMAGVLAALGGGIAEAGGRNSEPVPVDIAVQGTPALGVTVGFAVDMNGNRAKNPRLVVQCRQAGELVYAENSDPAAMVKLGGDSSPWQAAGGAASCTAEVADYVFARGRWTVTTFPGAITFDARG